MDSRLKTIARIFGRLKFGVRRRCQESDKNDLKARLQTSSWQFSLTYNLTPPPCDNNELRKEVTVVRL